MTIRELEIMKAALEGDIIRQKKSEKLDHPAFRLWLEDSEKLLKTITLKLSHARGREWYLNR